MTRSLTHVLTWVAPSTHVVLLGSGSCRRARHVFNFFTELSNLVDHNVESEKDSLESLELSFSNIGTRVEGNFVIYPSNAATVAIEVIDVLHS